MKIKTTQKNNKKKIIILSILTLLVLGAGVYFAVRSYNDNDQNAIESINQESASSESKNPIKGTVDTSKDSDPKTIIPSDEGQETSNSELEKPQITRAEQSGTNVRVAAIYTNPAFGTCSVVFEKSAESSVVRSAAVVVGPSYYSCDGFLIPLADFSTKGEWTVRVEHTFNGETVSSDKQSIVLK